MRIANSFRAKSQWWVLGILIGGVSYSWVFLDTHLLWAIEALGTRVNGAKVEAHSLRTNLLKGTFQINQLQITNPFNPSQNIFQFDRVSGRILLGSLSRRKLVVDLVQFEGARFNVDRTNFGGLNSEGDEIAGILDRLAAGFSSPVLGRLSKSPLRLLGQLEKSIELRGKILELQSHLATLRRLDELKTDITAIAKLKESLIADTDSAKLITSLSTRLESLQAERRPASKSNDWMELYRDAATASKPLSITQDQIKARIARVQQSLTELTPFINEDVAMLKNRLDLPDLSDEDLSTELFAAGVMNILDRAAYWLDVTRRRMPNGTKSMVRQVLVKGHAIHFGKDGGWPAVLIRKMTFVKSNTEESISGEITNITSEPPLLQTPCTTNLMIHSQKENIRNLSIRLTIDHLQSTPEEILEISADAFPLGLTALNESPDLRFLIREGNLKGKGTFKTAGSQISMKWDTALEGVKYTITSRHRQIQDTLTEASQALSAFNFTGHAEGPFDEIQFIMRSELGKSVAEHIRRDYRHAIAAIDETLKQLVLDITSPKQKSLTFEVNSLNETLQAEITGRINALQHIANVAQKRVK